MTTPLTILIADPDRVYAKYLEKELANFFEDIHFVSVHSGKELVALFKDQQPDIVLMELILPEIDGIQALEQMQKQAYKSTIILHSAVKNKEVIQKAMQLGVAGFIQKPSFPKEIYKKTQMMILQKGSTIYNDTETNNPKENHQQNIVIVLSEIGISPHLDGYQYIKTGVQLAMDDPSILERITSDLYPTIGEICDCSASQVERSMRYAIRHTFEDMDVITMETLFGYSPEETHHYPTNGEFIAIVADHALMRDIPLQ